MIMFNFFDWYIELIKGSSINTIDAVMRAAI
jgi:hypothetical protein